MGKQAIELRPDEELKEKVYVYHMKPFLFTHMKEKAYMYITNQRIHLTINFSKEVDLEAQDIVSVEKCKIQIFPVGILIKMKDGKQYRLSVLKREQLLQEINKLIA